jgi:hypothetical protein
VGKKQDKAQPLRSGYTPKAGKKSGNIRVSQGPKAAQQTAFELNIESDLRMIEQKMRSCIRSLIESPWAQRQPTLSWQAFRAAIRQVLKGTTEPELMAYPDEMPACEQREFSEKLKGLMSLVYAYEKKKSKLLVKK